MVAVLSVLLVWLLVWVSVSVIRWSCPSQAVVAGCRLPKVTGSAVKVMGDEASGTTTRIKTSTSASTSARPFAFGRGGTAKTRLVMRVT